MDNETISRIFDLAKTLGYHASQAGLEAHEVGVSSFNPKHYFTVIFTSEGVRLTGVETLDEAFEAWAIGNAIGSALK